MTMVSHAPSIAGDPTRPFGVLEAPTLTALVTLIRLSLRSTSCRERASIGAITVTTITGGTKLRHCAAASAEKTADRLLEPRTTLSRRTTSRAAL